MTLRGIQQPQVIFVDRDLALLNDLEDVFPAIPLLLCLWHIFKDVQAHVRSNAFPQELDSEKSRPRAPKFRDSDQHTGFCNAF